MIRNRYSLLIKKGRHFCAKKQAQICNLKLFETEGVFYADVFIKKEVLLSALMRQAEPLTDSIKRSATVAAERLLVKKTKRLKSKTVQFFRFEEHSTRFYPLHLLRANETSI